MKTKNEKKMKRITFTLPEQLEQKLISIQSSTGYAISDLIRQGLVLLIKSYE